MYNLDASCPQKCSMLVEQNKTAKRTIKMQQFCYLKIHSKTQSSNKNGCILYVSVYICTYI